MEAEVFTCGYSYHAQRFHTHYKTGLPLYLFRLQTEGASEAVIDGRMHRLGQGDLLLLNPGRTYELFVDEYETASKGRTISSGDYYLICGGRWMDQWWKRGDKPTLSRIDPGEQLLALWRHLIIEKQRPADKQTGELTGCLLQALCLSLERAATESAPSYGRSFTALRMKRFVEEHATSTFKVEDAARQAGLSVSRAVHLFKECYGKTMLEYALEIRLAAALERMKYTAMTLEQIAESCGFGGYSYFHRVFKDKFGIAPGAYRSGERRE
ncbi:AraC family transcriptional regulator [Paenibacillus ehimensis]|uniref:AraC family transcriptional regulator n=1 Tax=Paenibacillus ehimensis TaxID=79264 RepID=UPI000FDBFD39|nr:AraC family transcriptional regulator [Paenibacillus ehimensis]